MLTDTIGWKFTLENIATYMHLTIIIFGERLREFKYNKVNLYKMVISIMRFIPLC